MTVTEVLNSLRTALAMNVRRNTIVLILRFVMNTEFVNSHLAQRKMHDLDQRAKVHHEGLVLNRHLADLDLEAGATMVTDHSLRRALVMNVRRNTIVLIPKSVMNTESANSHLALRKTHDLDQRAKVHHDDLVLNLHPVDLDRILDQGAGAMTVTEVLRKW